MDSMTWGIIGAVAGLVVGSGIVWLVMARRTHTPTVGQLKAENDRFKEEVNGHFVQTAELINELTDSYKKVFDHLSDGADRLVDKKAVRDRMPQVGQQEVRLRHIGASSASTPDATAQADTEQAEDVDDDRAEDKQAADSEQAGSQPSSSEAPDADSDDSERVADEGSRRSGKAV